MVGLLLILLLLLRDSGLALGRKETYEGGVRVELADKDEGLRVGVEVQEEVEGGF